MNVETDDIMELPIRITFVYGEAHVLERYKTWDTLRGIAATSNLLWVAIGDFNEVLHAQEHEGVCPRSQAQMDGFRDALDTCGSTDIGHSGNPWTIEKKLWVDHFQGSD